VAGVVTTAAVTGAAEETTAGRPLLHRYAR